MTAAFRSGSKVGVFVDVANITMNGGRGMRYDVLRDLASRESGEIVRLNAYLSFDARRAEQDPDYRQGQHQFQSVLRDYGYKVILKPVKWYRDEAGQMVAKANVDLEMAVDLLLQSANLDRILLATGDGDFVQVVRALQNQGCRVEVMAFDNVSSELRMEADGFLSGYLIPNLLPANGEPPWGTLGSRVRGYCYHHNEKGFGFLRFIQEITGGLWIVDTRHEESPYESVFFHDSKLPPEVNPRDLPSRGLILEVTLVEPDRPGGSLFQADEMELVSRLG